MAWKYADGTDMPCDACGKDTGCTCPPCDCMTCRHARGEATALEIAQMEAVERANRRSRDREFARESAKRMRENLAAMRKDATP